ncbi:hypothetical protein [Clostridium sp. chh4-2]|uniref:hypothetical protein n=1 Tax=Clostridium sp. chh4-2 TaxID=2067550 RepID=UPI0015E16FA9|nr:hypothetical protein [Clostridium sp. chh4-2]
MDDIRTVVKELRRIVDAVERIAKALEKQNRIINYSPNITIAEGETQENEET